MRIPCDVCKQVWMKDEERCEICNKAICPVCVAWWENDTTLCRTCARANASVICYSEDFYLVSIIGGGILEGMNSRCYLFSSKEERDLFLKKVEEISGLIVTAPSVMVQRSTTEEFADVRFCFDPDIEEEISFWQLSTV